ncbi:hypothetical protein chiPu_0003823 [Chiloscyllium punctatum]|uniref:Uncharacterized protein n=1 Tax=Chiloscyllium punctatum TaxID=137246 RepID=A0A401S4T9_CHIPU|nr:hypothetical protein [Chiloscyllium punctatum]
MEAQIGVLVKGSDRWAIGSLAHRITGSSDRWLIRSLGHRITGSSDRWLIGSLAHRIAGPSDRWAIGSLGHHPWTKPNGKTSENQARSTQRRSRFKLDSCQDRKLGQPLQQRPHCRPRPTRHERLPEAKATQGKPMAEAFTYERK